MQWCLVGLAKKIKFGEDAHLKNRILLLAFEHLLGEGYHILRVDVHRSLFLFFIELSGYQAKHFHIIS